MDKYHLFFHIQTLPHRDRLHKKLRVLPSGEKQIFHGEYCMHKSEDNLLAKVRQIVVPYGCIVNGLGPDAVGVMGDSRVVGPSVFVYFPPEMKPERIQDISTEITNKVRGITRVLQDIAPQPSS